MFVFFWIFENYTCLYSMLKTLSIKSVYLKLFNYYIIRTVNSKTQNQINFAYRLIDYTFLKYKRSKYGYYTRVFDLYILANDILRSAFRLRTALVKLINV